MKPDSQCFEISVIALIFLDEGKNLLLGCLPSAFKESWEAFFVLNEVSNTDKESFVDVQYILGVQLCVCCENDMVRLHYCRCEFEMACRCKN